LRCILGAVKRDPNDDPHDLAQEAEASPVRPPRAATAPKAPEPLEYRSPARSDNRTPKPLDYRAPAPADDTETIRNLYMPLAILLAGLAIELIAAWLRSPTLRDAAVDVTLTLVVHTPILVVAMLIAARFRGIELGSLPLALLKLAALAVGPSGLVLLLRPFLGIIPFGGLIELLILLMLFYALLGAFFDLDESDTWYCVMIWFIVWVATYLGLSALATSL
jgi:hypothetical protein